MASKAPLVTGKQLASLFNGITERRIRQLAQEGIIPKEGRGKYDLLACVKAYIKYLQDRSMGTQVAPTDLHAERARDVKLQADLRELDLYEKAGQLIPLDDIADEMMEVAAVFASQIDGIPGRLANEVARETDPAIVHKVLFEELRRVRIATADRLQRYAEDRRSIADSCKDRRRSTASSG